jgi:hypothetical protein
VPCSYLSSPAASYIPSSSLPPNPQVLAALYNTAPPEDLVNVKKVLGLLHSPLGTLVLFGSLGGRFVNKSPEAQVALLLKLSRSSVGPKRSLFRSIKALCMREVYSRLTPGTRSNPNWPRIGYPGPDPRRRPPHLGALAAEDLVASAVCDLGPYVARFAEAGADNKTKRRAVVTELHDKLRTLGVWAHMPAKERDAKDFRKSFYLSKEALATNDLSGGRGALSKAEQYALGPKGCDLIVEADVVVCGSGAGGGVASYVMTRAGQQVLVLEKSTHVLMQNMSLLEKESLETMYERNGGFMSSDGAVNILAGSTLGGGTTVNWGACFKTPPHVLKEWQEEHGLDLFGSEQFQAATEYVWERNGAAAGNNDFNLPSELLHEGMRRQGRHVEPMARNCSERDCSSWCSMGCPRGTKQGVVHTFMADAAQYGARMLTSCVAERVLYVPIEKEGGRNKRVIGLLALAQPWPHKGSLNTEQKWGLMRVFIRAHRVVSSCGSLHSPALLLRSDITCKGNVGQNLRLHPATCVWGVAPVAKSLEFAARFTG